MDYKYLASMMSSISYSSNNCNGIMNLIESHSTLLTESITCSFNIMSIEFD